MSPLSLSWHSPSKQARLPLQLKTVKPSRPESRKKAVFRQLKAYVWFICHGIHCTTRDSKAQEVERVENAALCARYTMLGTSGMPSILECSMPSILEYTLRLYLRPRVHKGERVYWTDHTYSSKWWSSETYQLLELTIMIHALGTVSLQCPDLFQRVQHLPHAMKFCSFFVCAFFVPNATS